MSSSTFLASELTVSGGTNAIIEYFGPGSKYSTPGNTGFRDDKSNYIERPADGSYQVNRCDRSC
jgi:hypothetical protein